jgi:hypothetical protein
MEVNKSMSKTARHYNPWIGSNYSASGRSIFPDGVRLLVLGESAYAQQDDKWPYCTDYPTKIVKNRVFDGHGGSFFLGVAKLFAEHVTRYSSQYQEAWSAIAFSEYIQEPLENHSMKPASHLYDAASPAFEELVALCKPTHVIAISRRLWDNMSENGLTDRDISNQPNLSSVDFGKLFGVYRYERDCGTFLVTGYYHPRYAKGYKPEEVRPAINSFLQMR